MENGWTALLVVSHTGAGRLWPVKEFVGL